MSAWLAHPGRKAGVVVGVVFLAGLLAGVAVDRVWTGRLPPPVSAAPLTVDALADSLGLGPAERARVREVVDSLDREVLRAGSRGPEALRITAQQARRRLEDAVPADRRPELRAWMERHHARMMQLMGGHGMMGSGTGRGAGGMMMPGGPADSGMMRGMMPGMMRPGAPAPTPPDSPRPQ